MKLAVRKEPAVIPCSGFHYMLVPMPLASEAHASMWEDMGYVLIDVDDATGERLVAQATAALRHQVEVAALTERALKQ